MSESERDAIKQNLRFQVYEAYKYGKDLMLVEAEQIAAVLGLEPPDEVDDMATGSLDEHALMAIARRDAAEAVTQESKVIS